MKTAKELNKDIVSITMKIAKDFPELSKYIGEMPVSLNDTDESKISIESLQEYYDSLNALLKKYASNSDGVKDKQ